MYKKWLLTVIATVLLILLAIVSVTVWVDPLFQYHQPQVGISYGFKSQAYQNPGIAKNFSYDSIIVGSSMTQNFNPSYFDDLMGLNTIKLSYSGTTIMNERQITELAYQSNPNLSKVFFGLDTWVLYEDANNSNNPSPDYLMDSDIFNDVNYVLNRDILVNYTVSNLVDTAKATQNLNRDDMFRWYGFPYGDKKVIRDYQRPVITEYILPSDHFLKAVEDQFSLNIEPMLQKMQDVKFYFFYPPYSILYWDQQYRSGILNAVLEAKKCMSSLLLQYPNVELYDFQTEADIITNLYNYKDYMHYHPRINNYMTTCFLSGNHRVSEHNLSRFYEELYSILEQTPIESYWNNPIMEINDLYSYLDIVNNDRYLILFSVNDDATWALLSSSQANEAIRKFGLIKLEPAEHGYSYIAIKNGKEPIVEFRDQKCLDMSFKYEDLDIKIVSAGANCGKLANVQINGVEYSQNSRGLNIVVYDKEADRVIDSVCFDLADSAMNVQRLNPWQ